MQLEAAYSGQSARRGADFGGIVGKSANVVAVKRDRIGELAAGDLHAVAGIAGEADDGAINDFALWFWQRRTDYSGHIPQDACDTRRARFRAQILSTRRC